MPNVERNRSWFSLLKLIAGAFMLFSVTGCDAAGFVVTGQLIDGETGKPMPNAWVHQEWVVSRRIAYNPNGSTARGCAAEQVVKTDATGKFRFERPQNLKESFVEYSASAYVTPLIPGYDIDREKSKNRGESHQVVVARRIRQSQTNDWRRELASQAVVLMQGWQRCDYSTEIAPASVTVAAPVVVGKIGETSSAGSSKAASVADSGAKPSRDDASPQVPPFSPPDDERVLQAAKAYYAMELSLTELRDAVERAAYVEPGRRESMLKRAVRESIAFNYYRNFVEQAQGHK